MSTTAKALGLLNLVASLDQDIGLTDLARHAEMDKATARRLLVDLQTFGFVEQDETTRRYRIGAAPVRLARVREQRFPFVTVAGPHLRALAEASGETCHLAHYVGGELWSVLVESSSRANRVNVDIGVPLPMHATASGQAFLAYSSSALAEAAFSRELKRFTPETVTDAERLSGRLRETRERGWAINRDGLEAGVVSVAAPIFGSDGLPVGTLAVAAPEGRADELTVTRLGRQVAATADRLSAELQGRASASEITRRTGNEA